MLIPAAQAAAADCMVVAHRGASGYLPEHTLAAYKLAIEQGADFIEPDVILTKDGIPIVRHESMLSYTTNVAEHAEFADRRRMQIIKDREYDDWFSEDFTAAEFATLRAIERWPDLRPASAARDGEFAVLTLQEVIDFLLAARESTGRNIGLYPEFKQVEYFSQAGLDSVQIILETLERNGLTGPEANVLLQSFEAPALQRANTLTDLPLVLLLGGKEPAEIAAKTSPAALARISEYAEGISVPKYGFVIAKEPQSPDDKIVLTGLVDKAHAAGLLVHVYTFRADNEKLPPAFRNPDSLTGDLAAEIELFLGAGIDGFFTDFPDIGRAACNSALSNG